MTFTTRSESRLSCSVEGSCVGSIWMACCVSARSWRVVNNPASREQGHVRPNSRTWPPPPPEVCLPQHGLDHSGESPLGHLQPLPANGKSHRVGYRRSGRHEHDVAAHGGRATGLRAQRPHTAIFIGHCARMHNSSLERGLSNGLVIETAEAALWKQVARRPTCWNRGAVCSILHRCRGCCASLLPGESPTWIRP